MNELLSQCATQIESVLGFSEACHFLKKFHHIEFIVGEGKNFKGIRAQWVFNDVLVYLDTSRSEIEMRSSSKTERVSIDMPIDLYAAMECRFDEMMGN